MAFPPFRRQVLIWVTLLTLVILAPIRGALANVAPEEVILA
jgi:hypothetical protein